ncbi:hypothetical protein FOL47_005344 [Perkinsus chesapeaki]|uniref:Polycystin cation channel PKD1/PKD2 domain-containing protein n=1 Tax=Perkinsus chesapeaki TaxID=330153 RepID=A0A7J6N2U4_PERCH|nr:hypothetical protein FOL47_005344 [Perkinsus chesapeaki]
MVDRFPNYFWVKMTHFASVWPWDHFKVFADVFPYAPAEQLPRIAADFINDDEVAHSVTSVEIRRVFYYHKNTPDHGVIFVYIETIFDVRDTNCVRTHYRAETVENMETVPVTLLLAVFFAALDGGVQVMMILSNIRRERGRRLMRELNQLAKLSGSVGHVYSYGNLASDVTIMALGVFRLVVVANDWMSRRITELLENDGLDPLSETGVESYVARFDGMRETIYWIRLIRRVELVLFMVIIFRLVKFPAGHPKVAALIRTISLAWDELVHFFLLFFTFQAALLVAALMCFGDTAERFSSPSELIFLQFQLLTGEWPFDDFEQPMLLRTTAMSLWMTTYGLVVFFTLINFFIAIISRAFGEAQGELEHYPVAQQFITDIAHVFGTSCASWFRLKRSFAYDYAGESRTYTFKGGKWPSRARVIRALDSIVYRTEGHGPSRGGDNIVLEAPSAEEEDVESRPPASMNWERQTHVDVIPEHDRLQIDAMTVSAREIINQIREKRYIRAFDDEGMQDMFMHYMKLYGRRKDQFLHRDFQLPERDPIFDLHTVVQGFSKSLETTLTVGFRRTISLLKDLRQSELDCLSKANDIEELLPKMETAKCASEQLERKVFGQPLTDDMDPAELLERRSRHMHEVINRLNTHIMNTASMLDQYLPPPDWRPNHTAPRSKASPTKTSTAVDNALQKRRVEAQKKRQVEALLARRARRGPPSLPPKPSGRVPRSIGERSGATRPKHTLTKANPKLPMYQPASADEIRNMLEQAKRSQKP